MEGNNKRLVRRLSTNLSAMSSVKRKGTATSIQVGVGGEYNNSTTTAPLEPSSPSTSPPTASSVLVSPRSHYTSSTTPTTPNNTPTTPKRAQHTHTQPSSSPSFSSSSLSTSTSLSTSSTSTASSSTLLTSAILHDKSFILAPRVKMNQQTLTRAIRGTTTTDTWQTYAWPTFCHLCSSPASIKSLFFLFAGCSLSILSWGTIVGAGVELQKLATATTTNRKFEGIYIDNRSHTYTITINISHIHVTIDTPIHPSTHTNVLSLIHMYHLCTHVCPCLI